MPSTRKIILVGNPNVGKSALFYRLSGRYANVSNYPGTTIEIFSATAAIGRHTAEIIDTPGVNSLWHQSEDERITSAVLKDNPDALIVQVCDSKNLMRSFVLTAQIAELKRPFVMALNLFDEARDEGLKINVAEIAKAFGASAEPTIAVTGEGIGALKEIIAAALDAEPSARGGITVTHAPEIARAAAAVKRFAPAAGWEYIILGSDAAKAAETFGGGSAEELAGILSDIRKRFIRPPETLLFEAYYAIAADVTGRAVTAGRKESSRAAEAFGRLIMKPFPGYLVAAAALYAMYLFVGVFAAGMLVDFVEENIFGNIINPFFTRLFDAAGAAEGSFLRDIFVGEYGVITMALTYAVAIVFPIVGAFFIFFGALEDSGYLPRMAALLDRLFKKIGLNGKAVLPMVLGLGCGTMATLTSRILEKPRERIIATLLLALAIPCSAQLGVILGILGSAGPAVFLIWLFTIVSVFAGVGYLAARLLPGSSSSFIIEIPPLRMPLPGNILMKVKQRVIWYLMEAVPLFIYGTLALFLLDRIGALDTIITLMSPAVKGVLGLPEKAAEAFLIGFFRRDYGAAGLYELSRRGLLDARQTTVSIVTVTLFVPCLAQLLVMIKERGKAGAAAIFAFVIMFSFTIGGLLNAILKAVDF